MVCSENNACAGGQGGSEARRYRLCCCAPFIVVGATTHVVLRILKEVDGASRARYARTTSVPCRRGRASRRVTEASGGSSDGLVIRIPTCVISV